MSDGFVIADDGDSVDAREVGKVYSRLTRQEKSEEEFYGAHGVTA